MFKNLSNATKETKFRNKREIKVSNLSLAERIKANESVQGMVYFRRCLVHPHPLRPFLRRGGNEGTEIG